jgi:hypothetical protein
VRYKLRYLCASVFIVAMLLISAAPAWAQGYSGLTYGPNGPFYGPYDYCVWSAYACQYY